MELLKTHNELVLFDGVCNLCTASVNFILKWESSSRLKFTSLQSPDGLLLLNEIQRNKPGTDSIMFLKGGQLLTHSSAVLAISRYLKFPISLAVIFYLVPRFIRDALYRFIARNRYFWFGKKDVCMVPDPGVQDRFL